MYYLERLMQWFYHLEWKRKAVVALVLGTLTGVASTVAGPVLAGVILGLLLVDFVTDDILGIHE